MYNIVIIYAVFATVPITDEFSMRIANSSIIRCILGRVSVLLLFIVIANTSSFAIIAIRYSSRRNET